MADQAQLVRALQLCSGALGTYPERLKIKFTGEWSHLGTRTIGQILDEANDALEGLKHSSTQRQGAE